MCFNGIAVKMFVYMRGGQKVEYKGRYLVNIRTKRIHDVSVNKPQCKLSLMQQENAVFYDNLEDALNYPNKITPRAEKCKFCFKN